MNNVNDFILLLNNFSFKAEEELIDHFEAAEITFKDSEGNNLMHYVIQALIKFNQDLFKFVKEKNCSNEAYDTVDQNLNLVFNLIQKMLLKDFPYLQKNNLQKTPLDLFKDAPQGAREVKEIQAVIVRLFDEKSEILHPGRKFVANIELFRSSNNKDKIASIPDHWQGFDDGIELSIHQRLRLYSHYLNKEYKLKFSNNLVCANLGFLIKKINPTDSSSKSFFVSIPITDEKYLIYKLDVIDSHSEQALIEYLSKRDKLVRIVSTLAQLYKPEDYKILLCVLDIDSTREVCFNCEKLLRKLQTDYEKNSFSNNLEKLLGKDTFDEKEGFPVKQGYGFILPEKVADRSRRCETQKESLPKLPLIIRASGTLSCNWGHPDAEYPLPIPCTQYNHDIKTHLPGVILHLPPKNDEFRYSSTCSFFNLPIVKSLYDSRPHRLNENSLKNLKEKRFFSVFFQTAFISNSGSSQMRGNFETEEVHHVPINTSSNLAEDDLLQSLKECLRI